MEVNIVARKKVDFSPFFLLNKYFLPKNNQFATHMLSLKGLYVINCVQQKLSKKTIS